MIAMNTMNPIQSQIMPPACARARRRVILNAPHAADKADGADFISNELFPDSIGEYYGLPGLRGWGLRPAPAPAFASRPDRRFCTSAGGLNFSSAIASLNEIEVNSAICVMPIIFWVDLCGTSMSPTSR